MTSHRIKDIAQINSTSLPEDADSDFRFKYIDIGAVDELGNIAIPEESTPFEKAPSRARRLASPGDTVISTVRTYLRAIAAVPHSKDNLVFSTGFATLRPKNQVDGRYLTYYCRSQPFVDEVVARSTGVSYPAINPSEIARISLALPSMREQRRIADFLDAETSRIDELATKTESQVRLLEQRFQELMRHSTTLGDDSTSTTDTGIPWMPHIDSGWQLHKISHNYMTGSGTTPASGNQDFFDGSYPWINSADINDGDIHQARKSITDQAVETYSALKVHPAGSLVIALYGQGATKGKVGILRIAATVNQACCALQPTGNLSAEYTFYWFRAHKSGIIGLAVGAGQPNLSQELIRQLKVPAPDMETQISIVHKLRQVEASQQARINKFESRKRLLAERRAALITAAVTGQFDVSTASGRGVGV